MTATPGSIHIHIDPDVSVQLRRVSREQDRPMSRVVRSALVAYLNEWEAKQ